MILNFFFIIISKVAGNLLPVCMQQRINMRSVHYDQSRFLGAAAGPRASESESQIRGTSAPTWLCDLGQVTHYSGLQLFIPVK